MVGGLRSAKTTRRSERKLAGRSDDQSAYAALRRCALKHRRTKAASCRCRLGDTDDVAAARSTGSLRVGWGSARCSQGSHASKQARLKARGSNDIWVVSCTRALPSLGALRADAVDGRCVSAAQGQLSLGFWRSIAGSGPEARPRRRKRRPTRSARPDSQSSARRSCDRCSSHCRCQRMALVAGKTRVSVLAETARDA